MNQSNTSLLYFKRLMSRKTYNKNTNKYPDVKIDKVNNYISTNEKKEVLKPKELFTKNEPIISKEIAFNSKKLKAFIFIPQIAAISYFLFTPMREFTSERINYAFLETYKLFSLYGLIPVR
jgi:hypothetical protein